jgi:hypothetical protein
MIDSAEQRQHHTDGLDGQLLRRYALFPGFPSSLLERMTSSSPSPFSGKPFIQLNQRLNLSLQLPLLLTPRLRRYKPISTSISIPSKLLLLPPPSPPTSPKEISTHLSHSPAHKTSSATLSLLPSTSPPTPQTPFPGPPPPLLPHDHSARPPCLQTSHSRPHNRPSGCGIDGAGRRT